ncbi:MAG: 4-hydroxy-tetrahydrodipicolinate reductase [Saprospiraceae bacterium]|nr:4-hydroxy-tetrahydrodipicolinate reductase [Saprospiraceae bacterium]
MKIGLLGYGKMGHAIEKIAVGQDVEIIWRIGSKNLQERTPETLRLADVVIEFSRPEAAFDNVQACLNAGVPVVSGTTGWTQQLAAAHQICREQNSAMIWASNFSIGVNLFFALNKYLTKLLATQPQYIPSLTEIHHIHKLDAPSGTAITLANDLIAHHPDYSGHFLAGDSSNHDGPNIPIYAIREGEVPGTHIIKWQSPVDAITIEHQAHTREGFALGALTAARWLAGKKGVFTMADVLSIK